MNYKDALTSPFQSREHSPTPNSLTQTPNLMNPYLKIGIPLVAGVGLGYGIHYLKNKFRPKQQLKPKVNYTNRYI